MKKPKKQLRCVHYLNQFFGQVGGEEKANMPLQIIDGFVGPGAVFQKALHGEGS
ncbi:MAG TPA: glycine/sarcosine/betaine reductase selenoprotein B family protein, partial [Dehalococcoidales bacterium]